MKAQIYDDGMVRIFGRDQHIICDLYADKPYKVKADAAMKRARIVRRGDWKRYSWGYEATVRFESRRHSGSRHDG